MSGPYRESAECTDNRSRFKHQMEVRRVLLFMMGPALCTRTELEAKERVRTLEADGLNYAIICSKRACEEKDVFCKDLQ